MTAAEMCGLGTALGRILLLFCCLAGSGVMAEGEEQWRVLLEPKFMRHEVSFPISGAERTVLAPALVKEGEITLITRKQFERVAKNWEVFREIAQRNAAQTLDKLKPELVRNRKGVIEYARLQSSDPLTASVVLAPGFLAQFEETFGPEVLVAIPNRFTIYIFPKLAGNVQEYWPMIFDAYRATSYPVSVEVFELGPAGLKAIGVFEEP